MSTFRHTALALALGCALPGHAAAAADLQTEVAALKARLAELEARLAAQPASPAPAAAGMTAEQQQEFNRVAIKAEALEDARDAAGLRQLKISGYADPAWVYNQRQDRAGFQFLNSVADGGYSYDNSYFGSVMLDLLKETESGTRWHLALAPNRGVGAVVDGKSIVNEASVSIPLTDLQTRLIAGQIPDWSGYEYQAATLNKLVTHNLLFDFTVPTAYTGAGLEITSGKWISKALLANVNATIRKSGEKRPVLAYRVDYAKGEFNGFGFAGQHGQQTNLADPALKASRFDLVELDGYFIRGDWTLQGQLAVGRHKGAAIAPDPLSGALRDAQWAGVSGLAGYKFSSRLEGVLRADYLYNRKNGGGLFGYTGYWNPAQGIHGDYRNGIGVAGNADCLADPASGACNRGANRSALSLGLLYLFDLNTQFRLEYRQDLADTAVLVDVRDGSYHRDNSVLAASALVSF
ncbi:DUF3138 family protein [Niveibacterium umoris]|uniref:DUF3138 family protein n=1 Tax=Niveibacterium umoris TaxID=1193620 RepID=A0A840BBP4_9RHOO|nr:DUF3138 family protein [Niveibacterium umoris]MBB4010961.1 hypothetical protein [Niveibacterium umoris]